MRTALFWVITQRVVVIYYRRFGTSYRSHLQGSGNSSFWPLKMEPVGFPKRRYEMTTTSPIITQKGAVLIPDKPFFSSDLILSRVIAYCKRAVKSLSKCKINCIYSFRKNIWCWRKISRRFWDPAIFFVWRGFHVPHYKSSHMPRLKQHLTL